jgi:hypothetical protein
MLMMCRPSPQAAAPMRFFPFAAIPLRRELSDVEVKI